MALKENDLFVLKTGYNSGGELIEVQSLLFMEVVNSSVKKRIARYLDAILFIAALLLISSLLEIIKL